MFFRKSLNTSILDFPAHRRRKAWFSTAFVDDGIAMVRGDKSRCRGNLCTYAEILSPSGGWQAIAVWLFLRQLADFFAN
jgi:hypothetical protein